VYFHDCYEIETVFKLQTGLQLGTFPVVRTALLAGAAVLGAGVCI
jgi:hypothetical protein